MVLGHSALPNAFQKFVWAFHMPLFFILSGILFHPQKLSLGAFLKRVLFRLIIPYILLFISGLGVYNSQSSRKR